LRPSIENGWRMVPPSGAKMVLTNLLLFLVLLLVLPPHAESRWTNKLTMKQLKGNSWIT
jgi:hypothetical protein